MKLAPAVRRALLTVHVASSVGWYGAVMAYIALNVPAVKSEDEAIVRASYLMMEPVLIYAVTPLALTALVTGVVQAWGTPWGLMQHYWVTISLLSTALATAVLVLHIPAVSTLADVASQPEGDVFALGGDMVHAVGGLAVLTIPLVLNMYKPRGLTRYGLRVQDARRAAPTAVEA